MSTSRIWMFHRVLPDRPQAFGLPSCYHLLGTAVTPVEWCAWLDRIERTQSLWRHVVEGEVDSAPVITFDDGYREWVDLVLPSLESRGLEATFFGCLAFRAGAARAHPLDAFYWVLDNTLRATIKFEWQSTVFLLSELDTPAGKLRAASGALKASMKSLRTNVAWCFVERLASAAGVAVPHDLHCQLYPSDAEWRQLAAHQTVGGHGKTHRRLTVLAPAELDDELTASRLWLHELGGELLWSHPDGDHDAGVDEAVERAEFVAAVAIDQAAPRWGHARVFATTEALRSWRPRDTEL